MPLDTVYRGGQFPDLCLVCGPRRFRPGGVVQLRHGMRLCRCVEAVGDTPGVRRGHDRRRGELRDRDVVRMPVPAIRSERHHDIGTNPPHLPGDTSDYLAWLRTMEMLVMVIEHGHVAHTEHFCRGPKLALADRGQGQRPGMLWVVRAKAAEAAGVASRGGDEQAAP